MKNSQLKKISEKKFVNCMESSKEFVLRDVAYNSNLSGTIIVKLKTEIDLECSETSGFLTVGEIFQGKWIWNRRWCKINGLTMLFWNYPQENMEKVCFFIYFQNAFVQKILISFYLVTNIYNRALQMRF